MTNIWNTMSQIDTRSITEKKNGFTYLSWSHALRLLKDYVPHAKVIKHTFDVAGIQLPYMRDEAGYAYVMVTVDLGDGDVTTEIMPVLNHANRPIQNPNSFEVNAQLQRCMAKCISMSTGLAIHLYAGEDLPRPVEAVGADSSAQQAASGGSPAGTEPKMSMSGSISNLNNNVNNREASDKPAGLHKPDLPLQRLIEMAPNMESLVKLFNQHKDNLTSIDKDLFTARKKELQHNG